MKRAKFLFYAINGLGIGHVTRIGNIARRVAELAPSFGIEPRMLLATTSEAWLKLQRFPFPVVKIPSDHLATGLKWSEYRAMGFALVKGVIEGFRPDVLIVDTVPAGKFGEFGPGPGRSPLALVRKSVFIYRPVRPEVSSQAEFRDAVGGYSLLIVPEEAGSISAAPRSKARVIYTGPIVSFDQSDLWSRRRARKHWRVAPSALAVYISTGGGGHHTAARVLQSVIRGVRRLPRTQMFLAPGPLFREMIPGGAGITKLTDFAPEALFPAMDLAVSAAGYNTFNELMAAGVPTVFTPLSADADDQRSRAARAVAVGAGACLESGDPESVVFDALAKWVPPPARFAAARAARALVPEGGADRAAEAILTGL